MDAFTRRATQTVAVRLDQVEHGHADPSTDPPFLAPR